MNKFIAPLDGVANIVECSEDFAAGRGWDAAGEVQSGWVLEAGQWVSEPLAALAQRARDAAKARRAAVTESIVGEQTAVNLALMRGVELAFSAAAVGLSQEEAEEAQRLLALSEKIAAAERALAESLADIDTAEAAGNRDALMAMLAGA